MLTVKILFGKVLLMRLLQQNKVRSVALTLLLIILPISSSLCIDMYLPAYPALAKSFAVSEGMINLSLSIYLFGLAFGQLLYGPLADRFGRKKVLLVGLSLFFVASLMCALSHSLGVFLLARLLQAFGACSSIILSRAIVADIYQRQHRTRMLALISAANIFSPALAPLYGGFLVVAFNWRLIFITLTIFACLMLCGVVFVLKETLLDVDTEALRLTYMLRNLLRLFANRIFTGFIISLALLYALVFTWVALAPGVLMHYCGVASSSFALFFIIPALGNTCGDLFIARFSQKIRASRLFKIGFAVLLFGVGLLLILFFVYKGRQPLLIVMPVMLMFFGYGVIIPQLISGALAPFLQTAGFTSGVIGFVQMLSGAVVGLLVSLFYSSYLTAMVVFMLVIALLACCSFIWAVRGNRGLATAPRLT